MASSYKTLKGAKRNNPTGLPIVRVGDLYLTGLHPLDAVSVLTEGEEVTGYISLLKLDRIGNGNRATPENPSNKRAYE